MRLLLLLFLLYGGSTVVRANNISVDNVTTTQLDTVTNTVRVSFDLSWQNSWRLSTGPANHDAAWVFVKYRIGTAGSWHHATVSGGQAVAGSQLAVTADRLGAYVSRDAEGAGFVDYDGLTLVWEYGQDGVEDYEVVSVRVVALEMVYVPAASFRLGSGGDREYYPFVQVPVSGDSLPYQVVSEAAIPVGQATGNLAYGRGIGGQGGDEAGPIPAGFPKGFAAFYCLKYEVSQRQFATFYNTLTPGQQTALDLTDAEGKNSTAEVDRNALNLVDGLLVSDNPYVALNYISPRRAWAYLDWAGLRPMTELEFEKAARGSLIPVADEFTWGTTNVQQSAYTLANVGLLSEEITNGGPNTGNVLYLSSQPTAHPGPARVGLAASARYTDIRQEVGAGYYGVMGLSGNVAELVVSVGDATGRAFTGVHGNGDLPESGLTDVPNWPSATAGYGKRGGSYLTTWQELMTSDREFANYSTSVGEADLGFRGVRTAE